MLRDTQLALENLRSSAVLRANLEKLFETVYEPVKAEDSKRKLEEWRNNCSKLFAQAR
jgi:hypothetical protein